MGHNQKVAMNFKTMSQVDVPQGRNGKHKQVIAAILSDLDQLPAGVALKVPLAELEESKENVRSALNGAIHKRGPTVATTSDENFFYVWNESQTCFPVFPSRSRAAWRIAASVSGVVA